MTILADLLQRQAVWRGGASAVPAAPAVPTGFAALDAELPGGGWPAGLVEVLCRAEGVGELQVVLPALAALTAAGHRVAWLAPPHLPYAPALRAAGVRLERLTVVRAPGRRDALWAAEQALRCLMAYAWPGNVRQLENAIERAVALGGGRVQIETSDLTPDIQQASNGAAAPDGLPLEKVCKGSHGYCIFIQYPGPWQDLLSGVVQCPPRRRFTWAM